MNALEEFRDKVRAKLSADRLATTQALGLAGTLGMSKRRRQELFDQLDAAGWVDWQSFVENERHRSVARLGWGGSRGRHTRQGSTRGRRAQ